MDRMSAAAFIDRSHCINCNGNALREVAGGRYRDEPLHGFLAADPWGESPLPYLKEAHWKLVRCTECGQTFHRHILDEHWNEIRFSRWMSAEAIKAFKAQNAANEFECERGRVEHVLRIERLTRGIRGPSPVRLLDFGCGFGEFLATCRRFGFDAHGVDRASPRSEGAIVRIYPSLDDVTGDRFHAITLFEVLEHVDQPAVILRKLWSRLVTDGLLVLETPDCTGVSDIRSRKDYYKIHPLEHINAFTHKTLRSIAERCGFRLITRGPSIVFADASRMAKRLARHALNRDGRSTQLYFRKNA